MINSKRNPIDPSTWVEVNLKAIKHNIRQLQKLANQQKFDLPTRPETHQTKIPMELLAVIKADGYGHGMAQIACVLEGMGVSAFAVSDTEEGAALRAIGTQKPILLFESTLSSMAEQIMEYDLMPTVCTWDLAKKLNTIAQRQKKVVDIHIKVDTGMGRLGVWHEEGFNFVSRVYGLKSLRIMGLFTHFPAADSDHAFTRKQINCLYKLVTQLDQKGFVIPYIHASNSMGLGGFETHVLNLSRPGLMIYGLYPHDSLKDKLALKPAMTVKSKVIFLKEVPKGQSISYGRTFFTKKAMRVATVPIGYNDGYFRALSNKAYVCINGQRCPVIGRVTMDQIMVDVTDVAGVRLGSPVVVMGTQKDVTVDADELASLCKTINYEILCSFGNRLPRIYK